VAARGILDEGLSPAEALFAQFGRRTTPLALPPFLVETDQGRHDRRRLLLTIEQKLVLAGTTTAWSPMNCPTTSMTAAPATSPR
jgi:hypothetical protein